MPFSVGDRVRLANTHKAHHPILKSHVGEEAEVVKGPDSRNRYQVRFDRTDQSEGRWLVHGLYLRAVSEESD